MPNPNIPVDPPLDPTKILEVVNRFTLALIGTYIDKTQFDSYASIIESLYLDANVGR